MGMINIAIDPGVNKGHGVATFSDEGELISAHLLRGDPPAKLFTDKQIRLAIEVPVFRARAGIRQQDIIDLSFAAGLITGRLSPIELKKYKPEQWKGQAPKNVAIERIKARLTPLELERVQLPTRKDLEDNVWDAVGIGLHAFSPDRSLIFGVR